ncbi:MAG: hypothetical protein HN344_06480, partial [Gammaproteobacteria bacterium]|nr:hypothetical protein [Gammaproteobacteria bacterium]
TFTASLGKQGSIGDTGLVLGSAKDIITNLLTIAGDGADDATTAAIADAMQLEVGNLMDSLANTFSTATEGAVGKSATEGLVADMGEMLGSILAADSVLTFAMMEQTRSFTDGAANAVLTELLPLTGVGGVVDFDDTAAVQELMTENTGLLSDVVNAASTDITASTKVSDAEFESTISGLLSDASLLDAVSDMLPAVVNQNKPLFKDSAGNDVTINDTLSQNASSSFPGATLDTSSAVGVTTLTIGDGIFPLAIGAVKMVPDSIPPGIHALPDGTVMMVENGIATTVLPTPKDPVDFAASVAGQGNGLRINNGRMKLTSPGGGLTSGGLSYGLVTPDVSSRVIAPTEPLFNQPTVSDRASLDYFVTFTYADGSIQKIQPSIDGRAEIASEVASYGVTYTTDTNTGLVSMPEAGLSFKPDYRLEPLSSDDTVALQNSPRGNAAFEVGDFNGDGVTDFRFISPTGSQILYGVE